MSDHSALPPLGDRLRREVDPVGTESATSTPLEPVIIRRVIDCRSLTDAEIIRSVHAAAQEALRERDRSEGREPYPSTNNRVLSVDIVLDFAEVVARGDVLAKVPPDAV